MACLLTGGGATGDAARSSFTARQWRGGFTTRFPRSIIAACAGCRSSAENTAARLPSTAPDGPWRADPAAVWLGLVESARLEWCA